MAAYLQEQIGSFKKKLSEERVRRMIKAEINKNFDQGIKEIETLKSRIAGSQGGEKGLADLRRMKEALREKADRSIHCADKDPVKALSEAVAASLLSSLL